MSGTNRQLNNLSRYLRFSLAGSLVVLIWTVVLPWLATRPRMADHIDWLEVRGIDGGAMYYTELEAMEPILRRLERPTQAIKSSNPGN